MSSPSVADEVHALLACDRALVVAPAGCGKTELLARVVAHPKSGRQLILTHTHAGVAALKRRLDKLRVPPARYRLETIAGWTLRYALAYTGISRLDAVNTTTPAWPVVYGGAERVLSAPLAPAVLTSSYDGVLVDEYQDCTKAQHRVIEALARCLPVRVVGDPLQAIFDLSEADPLVSWPEVESTFAALPPLAVPWRWRDRNARLGEWLLEARASLLAGEPLYLADRSPVEWVRHVRGFEGRSCERAACNGVDHHVVAIKKWTNQCIQIASRLGGRFRVIEAFDEANLPRMVGRWATASGAEVVKTLHEFMSKRMTKVGPELRRIIDAIAAGRSTSGFRTHLQHRDRLVRLAEQPSPEHALAVIDGFRAEPGWKVYRPDGIYQLRVALEESVGLGMEQVPAALEAVRTRVRHRGRVVPNRTLGTSLLVKGLEFDRAVVLNADELSRNELYVAITRGSRALGITSRSRRITPGGG